MLRQILIWFLMLLSGCASTNNVSYPPLVDAFGKVSERTGDVILSNANGTRQLELGDSVFVGDRIVTAEAAALTLTLSPGQILQLESNSEWTIDSVVTNGAVFGSQTSLESGAMQLSGKEYMPHSLKILTPQAEITTLSENFRLTIAPSGELRIDALDGVAVTVKNDQGALVTSETRPSVHVAQGSAPVDPDSFKD